MTLDESKTADVIETVINIPLTSTEKRNDIRVTIQHEHPNHGELVIDPYYLDYEETIAAIAFHIKNMSKDNTSTSITKNRIGAIRSLLDLLDSYNSTLMLLEQEKG